MDAAERIVDHYERHAPPIAGSINPLSNACSIFAEEAAHPLRFT